MPTSVGIDDRLTVGVVVAGGVAGDLGALTMLAAGPEVQVVHGHEDAALTGLQTVAHIGQRSRHDDAHRVLEVAALHLLLDEEIADILVARIGRHKVSPKKGMGVPWGT
jgi:hypothetical protein